jgi:hypothetical protein
MSTTALTKLLDLLKSTLTTSEIIWLVEEMKGYLRDSEKDLKPYTVEELQERIAVSEQQFANGEYLDFDDAMREIEEEFAQMEELEMADAV